MNEIVEFIAKRKVVVIYRGLYDNELIETIRALYDGGARIVEVTFDQVGSDAIEKACGAIRTIKERFPQMKMGSGTVTCVKHTLATKKVGGESCLSPDVNTETIRATKEADLISVPGTMISTEISQAHNVEANIVKVFPAGWLRLSYPKDTKRPINHAKFLAATGTNEENFKEYLNAGCCVAGISGHSIDRKAIAEGNFEGLAHRARVFTSIAGAC